MIKYSSFMLSLLLSLSLSLVQINSAHASAKGDDSTRFNLGDIVTTESDGAIKETSIAGETISWQLMTSIALRDNTSPIVGIDDDAQLDLNLLFDIYYRGFFAQSDSHRFSNIGRGVAVGYELIVEQDWQLDIISKSYLNGFDQQGIKGLREDNPPELVGIASRQHDYSQGFRFSYLFDDGALWLDLAANLLTDAHHGWLFDLYYSKLIPYKNWDIYLGSGFTYYSSEFNNYYYGVDAREVTANRPLYQAGSGYRVQMEVMAQYPLSRDWLVATGVNLSHYSSDISDSPLIEKSSFVQLIIDFRYVF